MARTGPGHPVRGRALRILVRVDRDAAYADILLDRELGSGELTDPRDRALLTELVMGTLRRRGTLDHTLSVHLARPLEKTDVVARNALRLGAYQLLYTRIPGHASLFETVEAVKGARGGTQAGLVNAVLRGIVRGGKVPLLPPPGNPSRKPVELSVPPELFAALVRSLGEDEAVSYLSASLEKPPFVVRSNPFRAAREALVARLSEAGAEPAPCRHAPDGIVLGAPGGVHADPGFGAGEYVVMDEGAQLIAPLLAPCEGESILDACAAPGGKTTHLAALSAGKARIVAADLSPARVRTLRETVARTGSPGVETAVHDFTLGPLPGRAASFDKVLVDAPCTGMGVIRRNPDAKWRFRPGHPAEMARLQGAVLRGAWESLKPGGLLVYSTCSPLREENEEVVADFLGPAGAVPAGDEARAGWPGPADAATADGFIRLVPHRHGTDGFFAAAFRKPGR